MSGFGGVLRRRKGLPDELSVSKYLDAEVRFVHYFLVSAVCGC
jgi:hypothetical protein